MSQQAQKEALDKAQRVWSLAAEISRKIEDGDLRGALARIGFAQVALGECLPEITAALGFANDQGFLPPLPRKKRVDDGDKDGT